LSACLPACLQRGRGFSRAGPGRAASVVGFVSPSRQTDRHLGARAAYDTPGAGGRRLGLGAKRPRDMADFINGNQLAPPGPGVGGGAGETGGQVTGPPGLRLFSIPRGGPGHELESHGGYSKPEERHEEDGEEEDRPYRRSDPSDSSDDRSDGSLSPPRQPVRSLPESTPSQLKTEPSAADRLMDRYAWSSLSAPSTTSGKKKKKIRMIADATPTDKYHDGDDVAHLASIKQRREAMDMKRQEQEEREQREAEEKARKDALKRARRAEKKRLEKRRKDAEKHKKLKEKEVKQRKRRRGGEPGSRTRESEEAKVLIEALQREQEAHQLLLCYSAPGSGAIIVRNSMDPGGHMIGDISLSDQQREEVLTNSTKVEALIKAHELQLAALQKQYDDVYSHRRKLEREDQKVAAKACHSTLALGMPARFSPVIGMSPFKELSISAPLAGPVLSCWEFLWSLSPLLGLSRFSIDALCEALQWESEPSVLLTEVHCRLLQLILKDGKGHKQWMEAIGVDASDVGFLGDGGGERKMPGASPWKSTGKSSGSGILCSPAANGAAAAAAAAAFAAKNDVLTDPLGILPPKQAVAASPTSLVTAQTWQAVLHLLMPRLGPFARAAAASTAAGAARSSDADPDSREISHYFMEMQVAHANLGACEYHVLPTKSKVRILQLLVEMASETKRVRALAKEDLDERLQVEVRRKEETLKLNKARRQDLAAKKEQATSELKERLQKEWEEEQKQMDLQATATAGEAAAGAAETSAAAATDQKKSKGHKKSDGTGPREPSYVEINRAVEDLMEQEACKCTNFVIRDLPALLPETPENGDVGEADGVVDEAKGVVDEATGEKSAFSEEEELEDNDLARKEGKPKAGSRWRARAKRQRGGPKKRDMKELQEARSKAEAVLACALKLKDAPCTEVAKRLERAISLARKADMEGKDEDGQRWIGRDLHAAYVAHYKLKDKAASSALAKKYDALCAEMFTRSEPLGCDSLGARYWSLAADPSRIYVEEVKRKEAAPPPRKPWQSSVALTKPDGETVQHEFDQYWAEDWRPSLYESRFRYLDDPASVATLIERLDDKDSLEKHLRLALELKLEAMQEIQRACLPEDGYDWTLEGEFIGKKVLRQFPEGETSSAKVVACLPAEANEGMELWHVLHDDGDEEDLEAHEVREAIQLFETSDERKLLEASKALAHIQYRNSLCLPCVEPEALGLKALSQDILRREAHMHKTIVDAGWATAKGKEVAAARSAWCQKLQEAVEAECPTRKQVMECLIDLEALLHGMQDGPDVYEDERMAMMSRGWLFDEAAHPAIGKSLRLFYKGTGYSDSVVRAYLPSKKEKDSQKGNDPSPRTPKASSSSDAAAAADSDARWHIVHSNGEEEVISEQDLLKGLKYMEEGLEDPPSDEEEEEEDDADEVGENAHRKKEGAGGDDGEDDDDDDGLDGAESEEEAEFEDEDEEEEETIRQHRERETLWASWRDRQEWIKGVQAAATSSALSMAFVALLENAKFFGACKDTILSENRSRARKAAMKIAGTKGRGQKRDVPSSRGGASGRGRGKRSRK
jgi:hypothetical protein